MFEGFQARPPQHIPGLQEMYDELRQLREQLPGASEVERVVLQNRREAVQRSVELLERRMGL